MDHVNRVIVHDKPPIIEPDSFRLPGNLLPLGAAAVSLLVQGVALVQVLLGQGRPVGGFEHASFAVVSVLWLALGVLVFLQRQVGRGGRLFLLSAAAGSTFLSLGTLYTTNYPESVLAVAGLLFFPPLLLDFARSFRDEAAWTQSELWLYLPPLLLLIPGVLSVHAGITTILWRLGLATVGLYLLAAVAQSLWDVTTAPTAEQAAQSRALLFGLVAGTVPGIFIFIGPLVLLVNFTVTLTWLPPLIALFLLSMSYAVLLFEFSEADLIVRRGVVYGVLTLTIVVAYGVLGMLLTAGGTAVTSPVGGFGFVAVTVVVGAAFAPIRYAALRLVDWVLYGRRVDRWELLQALSAHLASLMEPDEVGDVLVREIANALHLRGALLFRRAGDAFVVRHVADSRSRSSARVPPVPIGTSVPVARMEEALGPVPDAVLIIHRKPAMAKHRGVLPDRYVVLEDMHSALTIPLVTRSGLEAVLCLRPKLAHDAFDADDLELLAPVIRQASTALDNALLYSQLREKVEELQEAYRRIAREQEAERSRLARELHDGTAQDLAGLITLAAVAERQMDGDSAPARSTLDRLRRQAEDAYQDVRRASHALRPLMLDDFGLGPTLVRYLGQFEETARIAVDRHLDPVGDLPDDVELALFRVVQECMQNVQKHSGAHRVKVQLLCRDRTLLLSVEDDGRGLVEDGDRGIGLAGMRERIEAVGGVISVQGRAEGGVRVEARVPVEEQWSVPGSS
jgi:signal transduction histidine kinase